MLGVAATRTLPGSVSAKLMPDCAGLPAALVIVNVRVEVPFTLMAVGANALFREACTNVTVWLVTPLASVPPTVRLAAPLVYPAAVVLVTSTFTVQVDGPAAALTPPPPTGNVPEPAVAVKAGMPAHPFTTLGGEAITRPAGSASLKVRPVRAGAPAGLAIVKVSVAAWTTPSVAGAKAFESSGTCCTMRLLAVTAWVTRAVAVTLAAALVYGPPTTLEVTSTVTTHEACARLIEAPVTVMVDPPAAAATTPAPEGHVLVMFGAAATTTFAGSVSVKLMPPCAGLPAAFVRVNVSVEVPPTSIAVGEKALLSEAWPTVSVWLVTLLVRTPPTITLPLPFTYAAAVPEVTLTDTVQVLGPAAAFTPLPATLKAPVPAVAETVGVPPQLFTTFGVGAMTTPAGNPSLKVSAVRAGEPAGLVTVKVSVETWPTPIVAGAKALVSAGTPCTLTLDAVTALVMRAVPAMFAAALVYGPPTTLLTASTRTWQEATPTVTARPVTVMVELAAAAVTNAGLLANAPPAGQLLCTLGVAATTTFAGRLSVKLIAVWAGLPAPLVTVKVSVVVPPTSMVLGAKALLRLAWTTVKVWLVTAFTSGPPTVTCGAPFT